MFGKQSLVAVLSLLFFLSFSTSTFACACCVERGHYSLSSSKPTAFFLGIFDNMKFAQPAEFYMSVAGFDGIQGLSMLEKDEASGKSIALDVAESFVNKTWKFAVKTGSGGAGILVLPMPATFTKYAADHFGSEDTGLGVVLYKELSFRGKVKRGTGIFSSVGPNLTNYSLVFLGRGNGCDSDADYHHWRLELKGTDAKYSFFGKMNP
ncbi:MAG: hypothetical protein ABIP78_00065 [Pyrinomonadaceae bacterium]